MYVRTMCEGLKFYKQSDFHDQTFLKGLNFHKGSIVMKFVKFTPLAHVQ